MNNFEEKMGAVEMYIKYPCKVAPVVSELGYPERHMLVKWYKEYEATGTLAHTGDPVWTIGHSCLVCRSFNPHNSLETHKMTWPRLCRIEAHIFMTKVEKL